ncbi:uncharacterized protein A1O9_06651 [Exophiala aquamarina CBS 119918]|uniref:Sec39 domain-containing protein n=1 Tax=Exophiala aquamarina CBS 119918 TaxID=1182545 RepID=A0A072PT85_9EURO|nr:uncharacterized protein A1O9_06651 [Exophiala aquamarina CBS 119918]KEF58725.1 hypothetical protein A1O9_06651 [Exophiala aquamarina CBS 119918]
MSNVSLLTDAHVLLLAVHLASNSDLDHLFILSRLRQEILPVTLIYRLLLSFYPVNQLKLSHLADFLLAVQDRPSDAPAAAEFKIDPSISTLSPKDALRRCRLLALRPNPPHAIFGSENSLTNFIINWCYRVESTGGVQPLLAFVEPFLSTDSCLRLWHATCLLPVVRLQYDFYPDAINTTGLDDFQRLSGVAGVQTLLQYAQETHEPALIARDLDDVVSPWVHGASEWKRRRVGQEVAEADGSSWDVVNVWLLAASVEHFEITGTAFVSWAGPKPSQFDPISKLDESALARFAQTGLAIIYACPELSKGALSVAKTILTKVANIVRQRPPDFTTSEPEISLDYSASRGLKEIDLLFNSLLQPDNPFTQVNASSIALVTGLLETAATLLDFNLPASMVTLARTCLFGSERQQKDELGRILQRISERSRPHVDWLSIRGRLHWLRLWTHQDMSKDSELQLGLLSKVPSEILDTQILNAALTLGHYDAVARLYLDNPTPPLPQLETENNITNAILRAYDNATDGNRERGALRPAYEMLKYFRPKLPQSSKMEDIDHLIKATHRLSFYRLDLPHGIAFRPVAIRVQKNPLKLVATALEQDPRAYTKLDDLLEIGRSLVQAHLPARVVIDDTSEPLELRLVQAELEITRLAIEAALKNSDFDTAYSYITTRLSNETTPGYDDDISWRAAYAAGKYRPVASPQGLEARIENLSQRMELLSRALVLAPVGDSLAEILGSWRRHEEEMAAFREEGVKEERASDARADAEIPGAFGLDDRELDAAELQRAMARRTWPGSTPGISYEEHAPMGLFDVAKGAATALRKSSFFPLGSTGLQDLKIRDNSTSSVQHDSKMEDATPGSPPTEGRVRKRDQVTNMVTSGIVSGMGWVLGAQAQDRNDFKSRDERPGSRSEYA